MFVIFERLNTGGIALNDMEIRNCLYRGKLNNLLKELKDEENFVKALNVKHLGRRMTDRLLGLRFLAFYERTYQKAKSGLKNFINEFFENYKNPNGPKLSEYRNVFNKTMRAAVTIFGDRAFRLRKDATGKTGEWAPRPNAAVFQAIAVPLAEYDLGQLTRASDRIREEYLDMISTDSRWVDAVTKSTSDYQKIEYAFETWKGRLREVMKDVPANDSARCFSYELKEELYTQNSTCAICGQDIRLINDAALDHDRHYWRGGKTIPENARLVHRQCNLQRGGRPDGA